MKTERYSPAPHESDLYDHADMCPGPPDCIHRCPDCGEIDLTDMDIESIRTLGHCVTCQIEWHAQEVER
jgi:hypothetical protein